jgi:hypothetical protein
MRTGRAENWWEFFFPKNLKPLKVIKIFLKKIINENLKGSLKWL